MIRSNHENRTTTLTLARPESRNALTPEMLGALCEAIATIPEDAGAVVLRGDGPAFCAGFDLNLCRDDPDGAALASLLTGLSRAIEALRAQSAPVIAVVQGAAIAGGCALLGGADFVIATTDARFGYPVTRLGISPSVSAPTLVGSIAGGAVRSLLLDSGLVPATEAQRLGLVGEIHPDHAAADARSVEVAQLLSSKGPAAIRTTRRLLQELGGPSSAWAEAGLARSLGLVGGPEQKELLPRAWAARPSR